MLQDLLKVEANLQDKQRKEKEVAEKQLRIVAKLKEKVRAPQISTPGGSEVSWWGLFLHLGGRSRQQRPHQAHSPD